MLPSFLYCGNCGAANRPQARFCIACRQALPTPSSLPPTLPAGAAFSSPTGFLSPNSLLKQRYLIISQLGRGGMGAVYKAADTMLGNALRAVKEMSQSGLSPQEIVEATDAFKREALMLADLRHQNLPRIYDHFADGGRWYLVMDFIEGETLEDHLNKAKGGNLPVEEVLDIGIQLCTVLGYLHNHQPVIIFRDLKPANVMLTLDGHLYLIDFGIARHFKPGQAKDTAAFGSPGYAAPEQYGNKAQTTPQSDIYSLGATLHQLLSGNAPSQTPFIFASLPSPAVPVELGTLIMQMVEIDMRKRPASVADVKQELQRVAAGPGPTVPPGMPLPRMSPGIQGQPIPPKQPQGVAQLAQVPSPPRKPLQASQAPPLGTVLCTYRGHSNIVCAVAWSPDGKYIASASPDNIIQIWDAANGKPIFTYLGHSQNQSRASNVAQQSGWGAQTPAAQQSGWGAQNPARQKSPGGALQVPSVAWSPDGQRLVSAGGKTVQIWNAITGSNPFIYQGHNGRVLALDWSPDGSYVASGGEDNTIQVWNTLSAIGRRVFTYKGHSAAVRSVAWSAVGKYIASAGEDRIVQIWEVATGNRLFNYTGHSSGAVRSVAWSPDGKYIASTGDDRTVQVWEATIGKNLFTYRDHSNVVRSVAWSPNGQRLASTGNDMTVQVWDAFSGRNVDLSRGNAVIYSVAWSPDGQRLAASLDGKTIRVWQAE